MADPNPEGALTTLRKLQDHFHEEARAYRDPGLYHVLVQLSYRFHVHEREIVEHPKLKELPPLKMAYGSKYKLLDAFLPSPWPAFRHYYFGNLKGLGRFIELASAAASCLKGLNIESPEPQPDAVESECRMEWRYADLFAAFDALGGEHDHDLWPLVVHELAWRCIPGSPLQGEREIWEQVDHPENGTYKARAPYDPDHFRQHVARFATGPPPYWADKAPPFDYFYSDLPYDIFQSSWYAIELICNLMPGAPNTGVGDTTPKVKGEPKLAPWDEKTEARNRWIYDRCNEGVAHDQIARELKAKVASEGWDQIESKQGIRDAAKRYAERHDLDLPPSRQRRRKK